MKRKRIVFVAVLTALALVLSGCGSQSAPKASAPSEDRWTDYNNSAVGWDTKTDYVTGDMLPTETANEAPDAEGSGKVIAPNPTATERKLIRTAWLRLESKQYEDSLAALLALVEETGGYVESQNENGISYYNGGRYSARRVELRARIPAEQLDAAITRAGGICNLVSRSSDISDVTEHYTDTEARLSSLRLQEERLLDILAKADTLYDIIELESRLSDVRYQIESYETSLRGLDSRISYSTLNITLEEVVEYNLINNLPQTLGERLSDAWHDAWQLLKSSMSNLLVWLVTWLPSILLWAVILGGITLLVVRLLRRLRAKRRTAPIAKCEPLEKDTPDKK